MFPKPNEDFSNPFGESFFISKCKNPVNHHQIDRLFHFQYQNGFISKNSEGLL